MLFNIACRDGNLYNKQCLLSMFICKIDAVTNYQLFPNAQQTFSRDEQSDNRTGSIRWNTGPYEILVVATDRTDDIRELWFSLAFTRIKRVIPIKFNPCCYRTLLTIYMLYMILLTHICIGSHVSKWVSCGTVALMVLVLFYW